MYFSLEPRPAAQDGDGVGCAFAFAKIALSIVMGVVGQKAFQDPALCALPLHA